jgi:hypothetical protein
MKLVFYEHQQVSRQRLLASMPLDHGSCYSTPSLSEEPEEEFHPFFDSNCGPGPQEYLSLDPVVEDNALISN